MNEELIYGLIGISIILVSWCIILSYKLYKQCKETNRLIKRSKQARQNDALVKQAQEFWN